MSEAPDSHELARRLAVLEERMETQQAEYEGALDRLRADLAKRDVTTLRWQIAIAAALAAVVIGAATL